ncbi:twin-arginine translocase TatA/TatE family subunit [Parasphingorhabdus sp.]|uniref:twin-arginine translocase TatA/TatE family subunit n=1 Tax=Parasphingorhabdus sp. TaxID=2709688 RepID=UPI0035936213
MQPSIWQILIVAALVLILFGRGRISEMMGDVGKGIRSFKQGITDEETNTSTPAAKPAPQIDSKTGDSSAETSKTADKTAG